MNLYEHSSKENEEIGLYTEDEELLKDFHSNYKDLQSRSEEIKVGIVGKIQDKVEDLLDIVNIHNAYCKELPKIITKKILLIRILRKFFSCLLQ